MTSLNQGTAADVSLVYIVGRLNHGIRKGMRQDLAEWGLSIPEFTALSILRRRSGLSNAQLARRSMVTPQSMIEILAGLESRGLVSRTVDPNHARILKSDLTAEGERVVAAAQKKIEHIQEELFTGVPDEERELVLRVMVEAMQRLQTAQ
jgi:DNA-binding MarR family transcriptional regulator